MGPTQIAHKFVEKKAQRETDSWCFPTTNRAHQMAHQSNQRLRSLQSSRPHDKRTQTNPPLAPASQPLVLLLPRKRPNPASDDLRDSIPPFLLRFLRLIWCLICFFNSFWCSGCGDPSFSLFEIGFIGCLFENFGLDSAVEATAAGGRAGGWHCLGGFSIGSPRIGFSRSPIVSTVITSQALSLISNSQSCLFLVFFSCLDFEIAGNAVMFVCFYD